jgi:hypothetical protein
MVRMANHYLVSIVALAMTRNFPFTTLSENASEYGGDNILQKSMAGL